MAMSSLGDAFCLGDALTGQRLRLGDALPWWRLFLATPVTASNGQKIKAKNQGKVFLKLVLFFYLGDLIKKPRKGKKSVPFYKIVTLLLT